jgi:hypothetical protein
MRYFLVVVDFEVIKNYAGSPQYDTRVLDRDVKWWGRSRLEFKHNIKVNFKEICCEVVDYTQVTGVCEYSN